MEGGVDGMQRQRMADHRRVAAIAQHCFNLDVREAASQLTSMVSNSSSLISSRMMRPAP